MPEPEMRYQYIIDLLPEVTKAFIYDYGYEDEVNWMIHEVKKTAMFNLSEAFMRYVDAYDSVDIFDAVHSIHTRGIVNWDQLKKDYKAFHRAWTAL